MPRGGHSNGNNGTIRGNNRDNTLTGTSDSDVLDGRGGNDSLHGGEGDDTLYGGAGADTLSGGAGSDRLTGGADADVFVIAPGSETVVITDFENGGDLLDISAFSFDSQGGSLSWSGFLHDAGADAWIIFQNYDTFEEVVVVLEGVVYTAIDISDYIL